MRLNVYLQKAGIGSRREAERLVADGRVSVNGVEGARHHAGGGGRCRHG